MLDFLRKFLPKTDRPTLSAAGARGGFNYSGGPLFGPWDPSVHAAPGNTPALDAPPPARSPFFKGWRTYKGFGLRHKSRGCEGSGPAGPRLYGFAGSLHLPGFPGARPAVQAHIRFGGFSRIHSGGLLGLLAGRGLRRWRHTPPRLRLLKRGFSLRCARREP